MSTVGSNARVLYNAVAGASETNGLLRRFPTRLQTRLERVFEGVELPADGKRNEFLRAFKRAARGVGRRVEITFDGQTRACHERMQESNEQILKTRFKLLREAVETSLRASNSVAYMRFLSRDGFELEDIGTFLKNVPFFKHRTPKWKSISEKRRRMGEALLQATEEGDIKRIIRILERGCASVRGIDEMDRSFIVESTLLLLKAKKIENAAGKLATALQECEEYESEIDGLSEEEEGCLKSKDGFGEAEALKRCGLVDYKINGEITLFRIHRVFRCGDIRGYTTPWSRETFGKYAAFTHEHVIMVPNDKADILQHELQHVFDNLIRARQGGYDFEEEQTRQEYRAYIAGKLFSRQKKDIPDEKAVLSIFDRDTEPSKPHADAKRRILRNYGRNNQGYTELLEKSYRDAYGLTYFQILEPFQTA